jgi:hypothetical protein
MTKCPNCFHTLSDNQSAWVCRSGRCEQLEDQAASRFAGTSVVSGRVDLFARPVDHRGAWTPPVHVACAQCGEAMKEACPECHYDLLPDWRSSHATCIGMNGARATGKSIYIAVAVKQLSQLLLEMNSALAFANDHTRETYVEVYERPLFEAMGLMPPTMRADTDQAYQREPLIFSLGVIKGVRRYLVIRDVAGEEMENPPAQAGHLDFLTRADGIFFLFDPLAVDSVRALLVDLVPAAQGLGGDPLIVLNNLQRIIGTSSPRLGVVLSKFDALHELRNVDDVRWNSIMSNSGAAFLRDPSMASPAYDDDDGELLHEEVKSLLYKLDAAPIVLSLENPHSGRTSPYRFFSMSALGESPKGRYLHPRGIVPFRVVDPLKWVLSATGVL